jgi:hypothetical protein
MKEALVRLAPREQQIADLLLQGCDNAEIAKQLKMARRTVKAHFNRLFLRFGITSGIKRVKLATLLYRRQICLEANSTENASPTNGSSELLNSWLKDSRTAKLRKPSEPQNTSSRIIFASSTTNSDFGIGSNSRSGMKPAGTRIQPLPDTPESWERRVLELERAAPRHRRSVEQ